MENCFDCSEKIMNKYFLGKISRVRERETLENFPQKHSIKQNET